MKKTPKKKKNNYPHNPYLIGYKAPDGTVYGYTYNRTIQKYEFSKTHISTHFNIGETQAFTFRQAIDLGVGMEELVGILFWKAKDMILKKNFSKFRETELKYFASKLSYLLPEARKEGKDDEFAFEQFILEAF